MKNELDINKKQNELVEQVKEMNNIIPRDKQQLFISELFSNIIKNPALAECEPKTLINAFVEKERLGLSFDNQTCYVVPYNTNNVMKAQFQVGYMGLIQLSIETEKYETINVSDVRKGEIKGVDRLTGKYNFVWEQDESKRIRLPIVGYIAYIKMLKGFEKQLYMTTDELKVHFIKYSKTGKTGKFLLNGIDNTDMMSKKTALKSLLKRYGVKNSKLKRVFQSDQAIIDVDVNGKTKLSYDDNPNYEEPTKGLTKREQLINQKNRADMTLEEQEIFDNGDPEREPIVEDYVEEEIDNDVPKCETCNANMEFRTGKFGSYYSCPNWVKNTKGEHKTISIAKWDKMKEEQQEKQEVKQGEKIDEDIKEIK